MKKTNLRSNKLVLKVDTIRRMKTGELAQVKGGTILELTTTVFSEGACEGYSWFYACE